MKFFIFVFGIFMVVSNSSAKKLPSFIEKCKPDYPEINKCIIQRTEDLKPYLIKGIPEMKIPAIDPLKIPKIEINAGSSSSGGLNAAFSDIVIDGASAFTIKDLDFDLKNKKIDMTTYIPKLRIRSSYSLKGRLLILDLSSSGPADANISEITTVTHCTPVEITKHGKHYLDTSDNSGEINYATTSLHFDNLITGNDELTETTNRVINDHIDEISKEVKPLIDDTIRSFVDSIIATIFKEYSLEELFA